ncbi:hypothetical protein K151_445 [Proteus hauseri ZMd44]|nr:hypothetical protein K151_445 [Proteus hauseri ZMd44]
MKNISKNKVQWCVNKKKKQSSKRNEIKLKRKKMKNNRYKKRNEVKNSRYISFYGY